jgi:riboflavin synthase
LFSGIIKEIGRVESVKRSFSGAKLSINCEKIRGGLSIGDSVAVNGVCLTVVSIGKSVVFDAVGNTLLRTNLKGLKKNSMVNIEDALRMGDKISGHMVSGHVDGERQIAATRLTAKGWALDIIKLPEDAPFLAERGSVAVDGVSLTVAECGERSFRIYLIPLTLSGTTLKFKKSGERVNIEFDMASKYCEKHAGKNGLDRNILKKSGFLD